MPKYNNYSNGYNYLYTLTLLHTFIPSNNCHLQYKNCTVFRLHVLLTVKLTKKKK